MKTLKIVLITIISLLVLVGGGLFLAGYLAPKPGGLRIESIPKASVFIDGSLVGDTPYQESHNAGEILLRLVPVSSTESYVPYETSINISSGIETVIGRNFAVSEDDSSGYVITFDKTGSKTASLAVISNPENAQVLVDGVSRGFSPYNTLSISPALHTILVKSPNHVDLPITVNTKIGYRLTFYAKLAADNDSSTTEENSKKETKIIRILDTPTGYLRVRSLPGSAGEEVAQVEPGEEYPFLSADTETGWFEIQYDTPKPGLPNGLTGWVSGKYATISSIFK